MSVRSNSICAASASARSASNVQPRTSGDSPGKSLCILYFHDTYKKKEDDISFSAWPDAWQSPRERELASLTSLRRGYCAGLSNIGKC